jgi:formylglycine-generating enzyme required for sulfatase activity
MSLTPKSFEGLEINDRLRVVELIEQRPFSLLFKGEVLALDRVVGVCSVTVYRPADKVDPDDIVSALRNSARDLDHKSVFGVQQVGVIRHGEQSGMVYATGEPVLATLSMEVEAGRLLGYEDAENTTCQACRALIDVHSKGDVHGRVRPYNLLKTGEGWKLAGAGMHSLEERLERFSRLAEEPVYLPPENYRAGLFGKGVDAWALGICVHLGQCGRLPYSGEASELLDQVLKNPPKIERLSGRSGSVVRHLLAQEAEQRWPLQQCIDHIEKPRGSDFGVSSDHPGGGTTAELRASGRLTPAEMSTDGAAGDGAPEAPALPDTRPLYLRPAFFVVCVICFIGLTYVGWERARLPDIPKENAPPEPLYSIDFSHTQVDPDGRIITKKPEQSTAYSEELGAGSRIEMVAINPGVFEMGSLPNEPYYEKVEGPRHPVQVGGFFISRFEITQQQWEAVAAAPKVSVDLPKDPSTFIGEDRPVEGITWVQAKEFCNRLSNMTGRLYRLPTEAEWEFACRAGTNTPFCFGETINSALANYQATKPYAHEGKGEYRRETIPVGRLGAANYFGLLDVHGNVSEWCEDRFGPYPEAFMVEPTGPESGNDRVVRGGSWRSYPWECRSASRAGFHKDYNRNDIGFRIVLPRVVMVSAES